MKLHSFANPCIFIGHFPLNIIKKKRGNPSASHYLVSFISFDLTYHASVPWQQGHNIAAYWQAHLLFIVSVVSKKKKCLLG